jgi:hypothetical protein
MADRRIAAFILENEGRGLDYFLIGVQRSSVTLNGQMGKSIGHARATEGTTEGRETVIQLTI